MLELGCGKGQFISKLALENQDVNFLAIDLVDAIKDFCGLFSGSC